MRKATQSQLTPLYVAWIFFFFLSSRAMAVSCIPRDRHKNQVQVSLHGLECGLIFALPRAAEILLTTQVP